MQVLDAAQHLIEQIGDALVVELHLNDLTQVGVHQLHHQVPVISFVIIRLFFVVVVVI